MHGSHSLRRRLLALVLAAIGLAAVLQGSSAYQGALRQADALFDDHLRQLARQVQRGVPLGEGDGEPDDEVQVQIWGPDGVQVFRSRGSALPSQALLGFSDVAINGTHYRVYALQTRGQTIQVAQNRDARLERARAMALRAVWPTLMLTPLLMAAVWWLIAQSLAPVERMRRRVAARPANDLSPLPDEGLPEEVQPLARELNLLFERVRLAFEAQRDFVADAAHELRSPLTALKLQAQALRRQPEDGPAREQALRRLDEGVERAIALVNQLLVLARQDVEQDAGAPPQTLDLRGLCADVIADLLPQAHARSVDLGLEGDGAVALQGRPDALRILVRNLLDNALKYTPQGGRVDLTVDMEAVNRPRLRVEDSGFGIPEAERERVFDRFYRVAGTEAPGSGLGLSIVRAIAQRHGATVRLDRSQRLGGLLVELRFPTAAV